MICEEKCDGIEEADVAARRIGCAQLAARSADSAPSSDGRVNQQNQLFGKAYSKANIAAVKQRGVRHVGIAPTGKTPWAVTDKMRRFIVNERAQIEGGIGTAKSYKYGFGRPAARSARMMTACGQRAILGANLTKLARGLVARRCQA